MGKPENDLTMIGVMAWRNNTGAMQTKIGREREKMPQMLIISVVVTGVVAFLFIMSAINKRANRHAESAMNSWQEANKVSELIVLYLDMAMKYGPKSQEAQSFRFGVTNSELWGGQKNSGALQHFEETTSLFDGVLLRNKKMFRWN